MKTLALLLAALLLAAPALAQENPRRIVVALDEGGDVRRSALETIADGEIVWLDITFDEASADCAHDAGGAVSLPSGGDFHLLVSVMPGAPDAFPFNALTCEYAPNRGEAPEEMWVTRLRGFYVALSVSEVTARLLMLRPIRLDPMLESAIVRGAPPAD